VPTNNLTYFLIGGGIGLLSATIGATIDFLIARRRNKDREEGAPPGCLMLMAGGLGLVGLFFIIASWLLTDSLRLAMVTGLGVLTGFFIGFAVLFIGSVLLVERRT
jgi:hypothetical protein